MQKETEALNLRIPPELKRRIEEYAKRRGISQNAAGCLLLDEALRAGWAGKNRK